MKFTQETATRTEPVLNRILVGKDFRSFDRVIAESQTIAGAQLVALIAASGQWRASTAHRADSDAWAASTAYAVGDVVIPTTANGHWYQCTTAGTSDAVTEPTWPTNGSTVNDNGAVWTDMGAYDTLTSVQFGVALEDTETAAAETATIPIFQQGAVKLSALVNAPSALKAGMILDLLIFC